MWLSNACDSDSQCPAGQKCLPNPSKTIGAPARICLPYSPSPPPTPPGGNPSPDCGNITDPLFISIANTFTNRKCSQQEVQALQCCFNNSNSSGQAILSAYPAGSPLSVFRCGFQGAGCPEVKSPWFGDSNYCLQPPFDSLNATNLEVIQSQDPTCQAVTPANCNTSQPNCTACCSTSPLSPQLVGCVQMGSDNNYRGFWHCMPQTCPNCPTCNGNGTCSAQTGKCVCNYGYAGDCCEEFIGSCTYPTDCSGPPCSGDDCCYNAGGQDVLCKYCSSGYSCQGSIDEGKSCHCN